MNDERAELLRKVLNFPERRAARVVREYRDSDLEMLKRWHAAQGSAYPFPDLDQPTFFAKLVLEDGQGRPVMAALGRQTCEAYLLTEAAGTPLERFQQLGILERAALEYACEKGFQDAHCWLPPAIAKRFGRRLEAMGWVRDDRIASACAVSLLMAALAVSVRAQGDLPPMDGIVHYGYTVEQTPDGFRGTVWAQYAPPAPDWKLLYTIQKSRSKAVKDCESWMDRADKAIRKAAKRKHS